MAFQRGASGNPRGRPRKGGTFAELLARELARASEDGTSKKERMVAVAVEAACNGELDALKWIADRTEGKTPDHLNVQAQGELRITYVNDWRARQSPPE